MHANALKSTGKSSKQTQHASASLCGCGGLVLVDDDPAEEEDDFEVELDAVDVVSFALAVVSLGSKALVSDSILAAMALRQDVGVGSFYFFPRS